jgi:hypothetical protein
MASIIDMPYCVYEDGSAPSDTLPCHWDASVQGNGHGDSFVITAQGAYVYDATPVAQNVATLATTQVAVAPPPVAQLASTGIDAGGALTASVLVAVGVLMVTAKRRATR